MKSNLTEEQIELYYQNIRRMLLDDDNFMDDLDIDYKWDEDYLNREADRIFKAIFGFEI
jgi:hypothetical protein